MSPTLPHPAAPDSAAPGPGALTPEEAAEADLRSAVAAVAALTPADVPAGTRLAPDVWITHPDIYLRVLARRAASTSPGVRRRAALDARRLLDALGRA